MRTFTREEFYELVWSKPMTALAKEFGLSDVALHKVCRKHGIPNPPLGWWAKKAAGKTVRTTPLPKQKSVGLEKVVIAAGIVREEPDWLGTARESARLRASTESPALDGLPHPIVARTIAALRKAKPVPNGQIRAGDGNVVDCLVGPLSINRLELVLSGIVVAAAAQGFKLVPGDDRAKFDNGSEQIGFAIIESCRRVKHVLTAAETTELAKYQRRRSRSDWRIDIVSPRLHFPEWDYHSTGMLSFEMKQGYSEGSATVRATFRDAKVQRLENVTADIGVALAVMAVARAEGRKQADLRLQHREDERLRREQAQRDRHVEDRRQAELVAILDDLAALERLRVLIGSLCREMGGDQAPRVRAFTEWAGHHLAAREQALSADGLNTRLEGKRLFGADDDHAFHAPPRYGF